MDRSSAKDGLVAAGTLGTFAVRDVHTGIEFEIGTGKGLTATLKQEIWNKRDEYLGKFIKYQHFPIGRKDKPRLPSFQGFRDEEDFTKKEEE
jgi:DNA ligase-1